MYSKKILKKLLNYKKIKLQKAVLSCQRVQDSMSQQTGPPQKSFMSLFT